MIRDTVFPGMRMECVPLGEREVLDVLLLFNCRSEFPALHLQHGWFPVPDTIRPCRPVCSPGACDG